MNQILYNKDDYKSNINYNLNSEIVDKEHNKSFFKFQFIASSLLIVFVITGYFLYSYNRNKKENISKMLIDNYSISRLYNNEQPITTYEESGTMFSVIGIIEIPKINISYPILSESNDELLKIAPCRISGPMPNEDGNLCIAGHNYDNYKFFSKISSLENGDEIIIYDLYNNKLSYYVFNNYEVLENNLSPLETSDNNSKQITLITCNNLNSNRIIIEAKP